MSYRRVKGPGPEPRPIGRGHQVILPAWVRTCADWQMWFDQAHCCHEPALQHGPRKAHPRSWLCAWERGVTAGPLWCVPRSAPAAKPDGPAMRINGRWVSATRGSTILYVRRTVWKTRDQRLRSQRFRIGERIGRYADIPF